MNNQNLYLVGTVHWDLDGKKRLDILLEKLSPSIIALEFHEDRGSLQDLRRFSEEDEIRINKVIDESGLKLNQEQRATLLESVKIINFVNGYEFESSRDYVIKNRGSRLEYIDLPFPFDREYFLRFDSEVGAIELRKLIKQITQNKKLTEDFIEVLSRGIDEYTYYVKKGFQDIYREEESEARLFPNIRNSKEFEIMRGILSPQSFKVLEFITDPRRDYFMGQRIKELYNQNIMLVAIVGLRHLYTIGENIKDLNPKLMTLAEYRSV